ncbi:MAG: hypothetical protein IPJ74_16780 [Saprospiraceae bacterium]|nr:hypothetical protein [Saprospiraceae bacterium]
MSENDKHTTEPPQSGNIWGWKFSYISLGIILFFVGLIIARHWMLGEPFDPAKIPPPIPVEEDSSKVDSLAKDSLK